METLMDGGNGNKTFDFHNFRRPTLDENMSSEDVSYLPKGRRASTASVLNFSDLPNRLNGSCRVKPIARHVEGMGWDERNAVETVLTEHYDLRRRKSLAPGATDTFVRNLNDNVEGGEDTKL
ncbi:uncharacterized protein LOC111712103 [Eurytemora carolleeae]|uniref:uncharacterized protein LOC111712103 n=1 Tax=Eurytemora carolleeae TaxID=1294199 RepID=UPI000C791A3D|nr:uncharacterized protein LOC111712103 [Eurytemora carolleeae]|eukprot:XP_023342388.1 uncharacterized protein LOC111712103 [Eurytemora affinis]